MFFSRMLIFEMINNFFCTVVFCHFLMISICLNLYNVDVTGRILDKSSQMSVLSLESLGICLSSSCLHLIPGLKIAV